MNDENFDQLSSLFRFEELGKLLIKKIEYLRTHGRENEVDAIMEEYKYVPDVCSFKINELLQKGLENDALKEIDKTIAVYGDDGYNTTEPWHLQRLKSWKSVMTRLVLSRNTADCSVSSWWINDLTSRS